MLATTIKKKREKFWLSQDELAQAVGISRVALSQIELGERKVQVSELINFARMFGVTVDEMLWLDLPSRHKPVNPKDKHYKLKQLILYISAKLSGRQNFGETLLNKLLYFTDFDYYERTGTLITDEQYVKLPYGPVPKVMEKELDEMQKDGQIAVVPRKYFGKQQKNIVALVDANVDFLQTLHAENLIEKPNYQPYHDLPHPKDLIETVLAKYGGRNADKISERSHQDMPYVATDRIGELIEPWLAFYRSPNYVANPHNLEEDPDD